MEQKARVLKMVEEGKISADEGIKLLEALEDSDMRDQVIVRDKQPRKLMRFLKIRVFEGDLTKPKVRVAVPIALLKLAMKFIPEDALAEINGRSIDLDEILRAVDENTEGKLLEVNDEAEKTRVEIYVE